MTLRGAGGVTCACLTVDGAQVVTGFFDGTLKITDVDPHPLATALARKPRELTQGERMRFGISDESAARR